MNKISKQSKKIDQQTTINFNRTNIRIIGGPVCGEDYKKANVKDIIAYKCPELKILCTYMVDAQRVPAK